MIDGRQLITDDFGSIPAQLQAWQAHWPEMGVLILLPEAEQGWVPTLQAMFREAGIPMIGAIFPALIAESAFVTQGAWLLRFNRMPPWFLLAGLTVAPLDMEPVTAAVRTLLNASQPVRTHDTLFLIFDGMLPQIGTIPHRLYHQFPLRLGYAGVNAGSETFQSMPCLFDREQFVAQGVMGLLPPLESGCVVRHGYPVSKTLMRATSTEGNRIDSIDGRPAFEVYQHVIQDEYGMTVTHDNFYEYAVHFPFGLVMAFDVLVRIPVDFNADGSLWCIGEVPSHALLRLVRAPALPESTCMESVADALGARAGKPLNHPLLTFYCAGRRRHFGANAVEEIAQLERLTVAGIAGALSLGEIDSVGERALPRFHNAAVVCMQ